MNETGTVDKAQHGRNHANDDCDNEDDGGIAR